MIVAHHGGELGLVSALVAGAGSLSVLLVPVRARLGGLAGRLRRRKR